MGPIITLGAGRLDIDYGKNQYHTNHAHLYQPGDESTGPYEYVKDDGTPIVETQRVLSRALKRIRPRLEMLGYTYESCKKRFELWIEDEDVPPPSFRAFEQALKSLPWVQEAPSIDFDEAVREAYARQPASGYPEGHMASMIAWERPLDP